MKQKQIIQACKTLNKLYERDLPLSVSYKLFRVRNALRDQWDFQQEKESEIFAKYHPTVTEDGSLKFETKELGEEFMKEFTDTVNELGEMDVDLGEFRKPIIHLGDRLDISMGDIEALEGFIEFQE